jgi:hypothetical protein
MAPQAKCTSTSTVGFPRESMISLAFTSTISVMGSSRVLGCSRFTAGGLFIDKPEGNGTLIDQ